jgi:vanillate O-demethylase ferredoxin subunit
MFARVDYIKQDTPNVKIIGLKAFEGGMALPPYTPGSHISVSISAPGIPTLTRCYSICNASSEQGFYELAIQREANSKGGSAYIHDHLNVGDSIKFEGPRNYFPLSEGAKDNLLIAGGIGITPIICMARAMIESGTPFQLHYAARNPEMMPLKEEVQRVCGSTATLWFDNGIVGNGLNLDAVIDRWSEGRHVYVCGPSGLISGLQHVCRARGWPESNIHCESFSAANIPGATPLTVELRRSGRTVSVSPEQSILEALLDADIAMDYDCRIGECGSCVSRVIEGTPLHRDLCLTPKERESGDCLCTCVSWAKTSTLVLDL